MKLSLNDVKEKDRGLLAPCGIICAGCDWHTNESSDAAKKVIEIWEGHNLPDVTMMKGLDSHDVLKTIDTLKKYAETKSCPGCYKKDKINCPIAECVIEKGFWTCAECIDYTPGTTPVCPHTDSTPKRPSRSQISTIVCERYNFSTIENLKKCREIGYPAFIKEVKENVEKGWRTWHIINNEMVVTKSFSRP
jgi:hypothetical protein